MCDSFCLVIYQPEAIFLLAIISDLFQHHHQENLTTSTPMKNSTRHLTYHRNISTSLNQSLKKITYQSSLLCGKIKKKFIMKSNGGLDMKILKSILNYIPLATFIIFVVADGIISLTSALIFVISTIGLLINWKKKKPEMQN